MNKLSKPNPFLREVQSMKNIQARVYHENDHLLPEDQWAQITVRFKGLKIDGEPAT